MANKEQLEILRSGINRWNEWRKQNTLVPDLSGADLSSLDLQGVDFSGAILTGADFSRSNMKQANLSLAHLDNSYLLLVNLYEASLVGAVLNHALLNDSELERADFTDAVCLGADFSSANLTDAILNKAILNTADLSQAKLTGASFVGAKLQDSNLSLAICVETDFSHADIEGSRVYGVSAWGAKTEGLTQNNLIITRFTEPIITIDNIEVAQLIHLLLNNNKIRDVIGTVAKKGVLILGSFSEVRKPTLDALRIKLREFDLMPMMFDFEKTESRDYTETVTILAGLSKFVIVDLTDSQSAPHELQAIIPDFRIPYLPIIIEGQEPYWLLQDLQSKYNWVMPLQQYASETGLLDNIGRVISEEVLPLESRLAEARKAPIPAPEKM